MMMMPARPSAASHSSDKRRADRRLITKPPSASSPHGRAMDPPSMWCVDGGASALQILYRFILYRLALGG